MPFVGGNWRFSSLSRNPCWRKVRHFIQAIVVTSLPAIAGSVWMTRRRCNDVPTLSAKIDVSIEQPCAIENVFAVWIAVVEVAPSPAGRDFKRRLWKLVSPKTCVVWRIAVDDHEP